LLCMTDPSKNIRRGKSARGGKRRHTHKLRHKAANDMFEDNSSTNLEGPKENNRLNTPLKHDVAEVDEVSVASGGPTTKFVCKVCGNTFDDLDGLNQHLAGLHHPKRTVTASDIVNRVFEGRMNFPKKTEIVKNMSKTTKTGRRSLQKS
jgi:hypothetical protein